MSIETELTRIKNAKTAIYNAIIERGGTVSSTAKISEYPAAINSLPSTGGSSTMEFYKCASVYGPKEVKAFEVSGCPTAEANGSYIPTEYTTESWDGSQQTVYKNSADYYYYYYSEEWAISTNYIDSPVYRGSGDYWYDSDWMTIEGMSCSETTTTVDTDVPKTWDGYKAVLSNGKYTFESSLTTGLTYSENKPEIFKVYSADVSVKADWLYDGDKFSKDLVFCAPLTDRLDYAETGQRMENKGAELVEFEGVKCAKFNGNSQIMVNSNMNGLPMGRGEYTIAINVYVSNSGYSQIMDADLAGNLSTNYDPHRFRPVICGRGFEQNNFPFNRDSWCTIIMWKRCLSDGKYVFEGMLGKSLKGSMNADLSVGNEPYTRYIVIGTNLGYSDPLNGYINQVRIYNRAFTYGEACEYIDRYGFSKTEAVFSAPLSESSATAETGQTFTVSGNVTYGTVDGISCATFDGNSGINFPDTGMPAGTSARTLSCWFKINSIETNSNPALFGYGVRENGKFCGLFIESDGKVVFSGYNEQNHLYSPAGAVSVGKWYHVAAVKTGASEKLYINGVKVAEGTTGKNTELALGTIAYTTDTTAHKFNGSLAACRVYNGALSDSEIAELAEEFTPETSSD